MPRTSAAAKELGDRACGGSDPRRLGIDDRDMRCLCQCGRPQNHTKAGAVSLRTRTKLARLRGRHTMWIRRPDDLKSSEITDEKLYIDRRRFLLTAGIIGASGAGLLACDNEAQANGSADAAGGSAQDPQDKINTYEQITSYNNFYEFGTDKEDPKEN